MADAANRSGVVQNAFVSFNTQTPRVYADIDRTKAEVLGVPDAAVFDTLQTYLGSTFINTFNYLNHTYQVYAQADWPYRNDAAAIGELKTRSTSGAMVPLGAVVNLHQTTGPYRVLRYNLYPSAEIQGDTAPGFSSGQGLTAMEQAAAQALPNGFGYEWTDLALQEKSAGSTGGLVFGLAVVFAFLVLAALYESVTLPFSVILIVPMCILAAMGGVVLRGLDNNILTQVGLIVLIGLAAKNAILIVEFARQGEFAQGMERHEAAAHAALTRLRPILMTSFAFIFGVAPLAFASGAGVGDAPGARHRGLLRHDRRDLLRPRLHADLLRGVPRRRRPAAEAATLPEGRRAAGAGRVSRPRAVAALALALGASACAVGPNFKPPATPSAAAAPFVSAAPAIASAEAPPDAWWRLYDDPVLDGLVKDALTENEDLKVAAANLLKAQGVLQQARAGLFPSTTLAVTDFWGVSSTEQLLASLAKQPARRGWLATGDFGVSYEVDIGPHPPLHRGLAGRHPGCRGGAERRAHHRRRRDRPRLRRRLRLRRAGRHRRQERRHRQAGAGPHHPPARPRREVRLRRRQRRRRARPDPRHDPDVRRRAPRAAFRAGGADRPPALRDLRRRGRLQVAADHRAPVASGRRRGALEAPAGRARGGADAGRGHRADRRGDRRLLPHRLADRRGRHAAARTRGSSSRPPASTTSSAR